MASKATQDALEALHKALADELADAIVNGVQSTNEAGEAVNHKCSASVLNVARQFLKDNNITSVATPDNGLGRIAYNLPFATNTDEHGLQRKPN